MRLPKKVKINNIPFKIIKDPERSGASFSYDKAEITIGTKGLADCEILEYFLHEVTEICMIERGMRSMRCRPDTDEPEFLFVGAHRAFSDVVTDVSIIVGDLLKLNGAKNL